MKRLFLLLALLAAACSKSGNTDVEYVQPEAITPPPTFGIDSLLSLDTAQPFNGVILISQNGTTAFEKTYGYANRSLYTPIRSEDHFVIGSLSKQFTAAMVLREYERGTLDLHAPIGRYMPELTQKWKDSVTIHHLLSHTHGIRGLNAPLAFRQGTQLAYSNFGYGLLEQILERVTKKSFADLSTEFFASLGLTNTYHPSRATAIQSYTERARDSILPIDHGKHFAVAAGGFISTAGDLAKWDYLLHSGKVFQDSTYRLMTGSYAVRHHKVFGDAEYGYGISSLVNDSVHYIGHSGFALGFASINYYFPESRTALIVLENIAYGPSLNEVYGHHLKLLHVVARHLGAS